MAEMLRQACRAAVAAHQTKKLDAGDRKQAGAAIGGVLLNPRFDRDAFVEELVGIFDEGLGGSQRAFQPLHGEESVGEVSRRQRDRFRGAQTVPEADEKEDPVAFTGRARLGEQSAELIAAEVFHTGGTRSL